MGHPAEKKGRLYIQPRDPSKVALPKPCEGAEHIDIVKRALILGFNRYEKAMEKLSKV